MSEREATSCWQQGNMEMSTHTNNSHAVANIPKLVMSKSLKHIKLVIFLDRNCCLLSRRPKNSLMSLKILVIWCIPDFCVTICDIQSIYLYRTTLISWRLPYNNMREIYFNYLLLLLFPLVNKIFFHQ